MNSNKRNTLKMFLAITMLGILLACSAATIITYINTALQVAVQAASVTGVIPPAYATYVSAGLGCVNFAATEMQSMTDSDAVKSAKIAAQCAALVSPSLPPGTPQNLINLATNLATHIAEILTHLPAPTPAPGGLSAGKPTHLHLSPADLTQLAKIAAEAKAAQDKLKAR